ncbi:MAG: CPBP family intramembrane metalloprotease [Phycisphaerales bacterium]|jgi:membrane protease YdiL (CAAX protease family)|nr:CPBP family intramembrane metalloprotease [Phycisphaerales bacterium]
MSTALPLLLAAATPTTQPLAPPDLRLTPLMISICGVGVCVLAIWFAYGLVKRSKFKLSRTPGRVNKLNPTHVIAVFLGGLITAGLLKTALVKWSQLGEPQIDIVCGIASQLFWFTAGLIIATSCFYNGARRGMGLTPRRWVNDTTRAVVAYLAIIPVCILLMQLSTMLAFRIAPTHQQTHPLLEFLQSPHCSTLWRSMAILAAAVMAPLGEEILFRGLLQSTIRRYTRSPWISIVIASILFSAIHAGADIKSLPSLFALAIALGYSYERTGRLIAPIMIHMIFNSVTLIEMLYT